jgi:hypothetical protein
LETNPATQEGLAAAGPFFGVCRFEQNRGAQGLAWPYNSTAERSIPTIKSSSKKSFFPSRLQRPWLIEPDLHPPTIHPTDSQKQPNVA